MTTIVFIFVLERQGKFRIEYVVVLLDVNLEAVRGLSCLLVRGYHSDEMVLRPNRIVSLVQGVVEVVGHRPPHNVVQERVPEHGRVGVQAVHRLVAEDCKIEGHVVHRAVATPEGLQSHQHHGANAVLDKEVGDVKVKAVQIGQVLHWQMVCGVVMVHTGVEHLVHNIHTDSVLDECDQQILQVHLEKPGYVALVPLSLSEDVDDLVQRIAREHAEFDLDRGHKRDRKQSNLAKVPNIMADASSTALANVKLIKGSLPRQELSKEFHIVLHSFDRE